MPNNFNLNQDCVINGTIVHSEVTQPRLMSEDIGRKPVYSVEITPEPGVTDSLALLYGMCDPHCLNAQELYKQFQGADTIVFETLNKPFTSGADSSTGEFTEGTKVKVSARLEYLETLSKTENGFHATPRLMLRFVDLDLDAIAAEPIEVEWDKLSVYVDF